MKTSIFLDHIKSALNSKEQEVEARSSNLADALLARGRSDRGDYKGRKDSRSRYKNKKLKDL